MFNFAAEGFPFSNRESVITDGVVAVFYTTLKHLQMWEDICHQVQSILDFIFRSRD